MSWVVRAGEAKPGDLVLGYTAHRLVSGLYGFSVQYQAGASLDELARAGQFPNAQISYADELSLAHAIEPRYRLRLVPSPGKGYHHTLAVIEDAGGIMRQTLPLPRRAGALSRLSTHAQSRAHATRAAPTASTVM
jgi:hypothetical protein